MTLDANAQVALAALAFGAAFGALARWSGFCLRGAVEDALTTDNDPRLRGFLAAMAVGIVVTQTLVLLGRLNLSKAIVLPGSLFWGGAMFGVGMVLTGGCGTRLLVLGCTIGNGLTGMASLAPTSLIALPAMVLAAAATMKWRWRNK